MVAADNLKALAILVVAIFLVASRTIEAVTVKGIPNVRGISVNFNLCCTQNLLCSSGSPALRNALVYIIADVTPIDGITAQVDLGSGFPNSLGNVNINVNNLNILGSNVVRIQNVRAIISPSPFSSSCSTLLKVGTVQVNLVATGPPNNGILTLIAAS